MVRAFARVYNERLEGLVNFNETVQQLMVMNRMCLKFILLPNTI